MPLNFWVSELHNGRSPDAEVHLYVLLGLLALVTVVLVVVVVVVVVVQLNGEFPIKAQCRLMGGITKESRR